jgi:hypothetical protein
VLVEHRGTSSFFQINEKCIDCFPSAAEFVMGKVREDHLPAARPGATSRSRRGVPRASRRPAPSAGRR